MMIEFKVMYNGKGLEFNKPIIINDVVYLVRLNMNIDDYKFEAEMDPMIDRDSSDPNELLRVSEKFFSKERLKEKEFIKLLMEVC